MVRTKTNTQNDTKTRRTARRNRHLEKTIFCVLFDFLIFFYLFIISKMDSPRNVELPPLNDK